MAMAYTFGHAGDGNIHLVIGAKEEDESVWAKINEPNTRIGDKAFRLGGTAIGEHDVGIGKAKFMAAEHGSALEWMKKAKALFDPNGILNPGRMFP
ncbi:MAG: FAD-binding oxidoreductase [Desulfobacterales bacterium]|nr:MAG: FAD-binding oxidoreductase [Desulfobacterales bacterium]